MERQPISKVERLIKPLFTGTEVVLGAGTLTSLLTGQPTMALGFATLGFIILAGDYERTSYLRTRRILEGANERASRNLENSKEILQRIKEVSAETKITLQGIEDSRKSIEDSNRRTEEILKESRASSQKLKVANEELIRLIQ